MNYNIVGTVQNVDDYVEIYAQGDDADIERFYSGVIEGASPASNVTSHQLEELELNQNYRIFDQYKMLNKVKMTVRYNISHIFGVLVGIPVAF